MSAFAMRTPVHRFAIPFTAKFIEVPWFSPLKVVHLSINTAIFDLFLLAHAEAPLTDSRFQLIAGDHTRTLAAAYLHPQLAAARNA